MGRPRKPTHLLVLSGGARNHPDRMRARAAEPKHDGTDLRRLDPPPYLDAEHADIWRQFVGALHPHVAMQADALAAEMAVRLIATMRSGTATAAHYARLQAMLAEFGMTPAARSRVTQATARPVSGFAALAQPEDPE